MSHSKNPDPARAQCGLKGGIKKGTPGRIDNFCCCPCRQCKLRSHCGRHAPDSHGEGGGCHQNCSGFHAQTDNPERQARRLQKEQYHDWIRSHSGKNRYHTWQAACFGILRAAYRKRDWELLRKLQAYECTEGYLPGAASPPHYHVGNRKRPLRHPRQKLHFWRLKLLTWPFYRMRSRYRKWKGKGK